MSTYTGTDRTAVTLAWLWDHPEAQAYMYNEEAHNLGLDPWITCTGLNKMTRTNQFILEYGTYGELHLPPGYEVYGSLKDFNTSPDYSK